MQGDTRFLVVVEVVIVFGRVLVVMMMTMYTFRKERIQKPATQDTEWLGRDGQHISGPRVRCGPSDVHRFRNRKRGFGYGYCLLLLDRLAGMAGSGCVPWQG
jgi:hypothetical protein